MTDGSPEIACLASDLHEHLLQMPLPLRNPTLVACSLPADLSSEVRVGPVYPEPDTFMANTYAALVHQVFDIS